MNLKNMFGVLYNSLCYHFFRKKTPLSMMFSVTNNCNLRCKYCRIPSRKQRELSKEEIFSLVDQLKKCGTQQINLCGGEPTIRKDIGEIIKYMKSKGMHVSMSSNGCFVPSKINDLKELDLIMFSFDGPKKIHELNRGKGIYEKMLKAIKAAKKAGMKIWTTTVLTKTNLKYIDFILNYVKKNKLKCNFQLLHLSPELAGNPSKLLPSKEDYKKAIKKLIDAKKEGAPIMISSKILNNLYKWENYSEYQSNKKGKINCLAGKLFGYIDTDGSIYPCAHLIGKIKQINFLDAGVKKAFNECSKNIPCKSCTMPANVERSMILSFSPESIINSLKNI